MFAVEAPLWTRILPPGSQEAEQVPSPEIIKCKRILNSELDDDKGQETKHAQSSVLGDSWFVHLASREKKQQQTVFFLFLKKWLLISAAFLTNGLKRLGELYFNKETSIMKLI